MDVRKIKKTTIMATIYNIKIKTVSPFCAYDEKYVQKMFQKFLEKYRDEKTGLRFENSEVDVRIENHHTSQTSPLTVKEFKKQLKWLQKEMGIKDEDYLFFSLPGEDEGVKDNLIPINYLSSPTILFFPYQKEQLERLKRKEGISVCFVKPEVK